MDMPSGTTAQATGWQPEPITLRTARTHRHERQHHRSASFMAPFETALAPTRLSVAPVFPTAAGSTPPLTSVIMNNIAQGGEIGLRELALRI